MVAFILAGFVTVGVGATSDCDYDPDPGEHGKKSRNAFTGKPASALSFCLSNVASARRVSSATMPGCIGSMVVIYQSSCTCLLSRLLCSKQHCLAAHCCLARVHSQASICTHVFLTLKPEHKAHSSQKLMLGRAAQHPSIPSLA